MSIHWHAIFPNIYKPIVSVPLKASLIMVPGMENKLKGKHLLELLPHWANQYDLDFLDANPILGAKVTKVDYGSSCSVRVELNLEIQKVLSDLAGKSNHHVVLRG